MSYKIIFLHTVYPQICNWHVYTVLHIHVFTFILVNVHTVSYVVVGGHFVGKGDNELPFIMYRFLLSLGVRCNEV